MTTFTAGVRWYPLFALPLLAITVAAATAADRFFSQRQVKHVKARRAPVLLPKDIKSHTSKLISSTWRIGSAIKAYRQKTRPDIPIHEVMPEDSRSIAGDDIRDDLESNRAEEASIKNQVPVPNHPDSSVLPKPTLAASLHSFGSVENLHDNAIPGPPAMAMVRDAAIQLIQVRSLPPPRPPDLLQTHNISGQRGISGLERSNPDRENIEVVNERNVAFDLPKPVIKRERRAMALPKTRTAFTVKPPNIWRPPPRSPSSYEEKPAQATGHYDTPLTAKLLKREQRETNEESSYSASRYSHGESEKGHIPSAFPRTGQPRDSAFKYTVFQRQKDSYEVVHEVESGKRSRHKTYIRNPLAEASTISQRKDDMSEVKVSALASTLPVPATSNTTMSDTRQPSTAGVGRTERVRFVGDFLGRIYETSEVEEAPLTAPTAEKFDVERPRVSTSGPGAWGTSWEAGTTR